MLFAQFSGSGSGTENDPYLILNPIQLNQMRNFLNKDGVYFKLMADIDLTEFLEEENPLQGWQPIGTSSTPFKGVLDGNGKKISGLWIKRPDKSDIGLFGVVSNVTITKLKAIEINIKGDNSVGSICGSGTGKISDCVVEGVLSGGASVGGYIGKGTFSLTNCESYVEVSGGGNYIGGLIGYSTNGNVENSFVRVRTIEGIDRVGGVCGINYSSGIINNTIVEANIKGKEYVGGLLGQAIWGDSYPYTTTNINECGYVGNVSGNQYVGGVCGYYIGHGGRINRSFAFSDIVAQSNYVGGIVGHFSSTYNFNAYTAGGILDTYFSGSIKGGNFVGGIVGLSSIGDIMRCCSHASISGNEKVGGICGTMANHNDRRSKLYSNVAILTSITASVDYIGRIYGSFGSDNYLGESGTSNENKAYNRAIVIKAGISQEINEDKQNGTNASATTLKLKATYVAIGWDFNNTWEIQETECSRHRQLHL